MSTLSFDVQEKLANLQARLEARDPDIKTALSTLHNTLKKQPENVTILAEDQILILVKGLEHVTGVHFAVSSSKGTGSTKLAKKLANAPDSAFGF
jgi:hypothetical protein